MLFYDAVGGCWVESLLSVKGEFGMMSKRVSSDKIQVDFNAKDFLKREIAIQHNSSNFFSKARTTEAADFFF